MAGLHSVFYFLLTQITAHLTLSLYPADLVSDYPGKEEVGSTEKGAVKAYDLEKVPAGVWEHVCPVGLLRLTGRQPGELRWIVGHEHGLAGLRASPSL